MKQKLLALSLSLALCLSLLPTALAAGKTYDQAVKELQEHDSQLTFKQSFETEYGTVFVCDSPNPHANTGWLRFVTKAPPPQHLVQHKAAADSPAQRRQNYLHLYLPL